MNTVVPKLRCQALTLFTKMIGNNEKMIQIQMNFLNNNKQTCCPKKENPSLDLRCIKHLQTSQLVVSKLE